MNTLAALAIIIPLAAVFVGWPAVAAYRVACAAIHAWRVEAARSRRRG